MSPYDQHVPEEHAERVAQHMRPAQAPAEPLQVLHDFLIGGTTRDAEIIGFAATPVNSQNMGGHIVGVEPQQHAQLRNPLRVSFCPLIARFTSR